MGMGMWRGGGFGGLWIFSHCESVKASRAKELDLF